MPEINENFRMIERTDSLSPKHLKQQELITSLQAPKEFRVTTPEYYHIGLVGVPKNFDNEDLRKLCGEIHVVNSNLNIDTLTGECRGATLSLRYCDKKVFEAFQLKLLRKGISMSKNERKTIDKSKYWELTNVPLKEFRQSHTPNPEYTAKNAKISEQLSSVFGKPRKYTPVRMERDKSFQTQLQWKKTRNSRKEVI
jgi:hypothetical protein